MTTIHYIMVIIFLILAASAVTVHYNNYHRSPMIPIINTTIHVGEFVEIKDFKVNGKVVSAKTNANRVEFEVMYMAGKRELKSVWLTGGQLQTTNTLVDMDEDNNRGKSQE